MKKHTRGYWTELKCLKYAKECGATSKSDLNKKNSYVYQVARRNKWLDKIAMELDWKIDKRKPRCYWTESRCLKYAINEGITGKKDLIKKNGHVYQVARRNKWLDKISEELKWEVKQKPKGYWTYEKCKAVAKECGATGRSDFEKKNNAARSAAYRNKWLDQIASELGWETKEVKTKGYWTYEICLTTAKECGATTRSSFYIKNQAAYQAAHRNNWVNQIAGELGWGKYSREKKVFKIKGAC